MTTEQLRDHFLDRATLVLVGDKYMVGHLVQSQYLIASAIVRNQSIDRTFNRMLRNMDVTLQQDPKFLDSFENLRLIVL